MTTTLEQKIIKRRIYAKNRYYKLKSEGRLPYQLKKNNLDELSNKKFYNFKPSIKSKSDKLIIIDKVKRIIDIIEE